MHKENMDIWKRINRGDDSALKLLFNRYYKSLCAYALQFLPSLPDSEDVVQGVFITLWTKRKTISIETSLKSYLYKSVFNSCMQNLRSNKKLEGSLAHLKWKMLQEQIQEDDTLLLAEIEKLKKLVDSLPEKCKEILLLSKKEGYKNREIAEKLGISIKTVESQIRIAYNKIRDGFKDGKLVLFFCF